MNDQIRRLWSKVQNIGIRYQKGVEAGPFLPDCRIRTNYHRCAKGPVNLAQSLLDLIGGALVQKGYRTDTGGSGAAEFL